MTDDTSKSPDPDSRGPGPPLGQGHGEGIGLDQVPTGRGVLEHPDGSWKLLVKCVRDTGKRRDRKNFERKGKPSRNKGRKIKSIKLEMKMERSQQTTQKYKGS